MSDISDETKNIISEMRELACEMYRVTSDIAEINDRINNLSEKRDLLQQKEINFCAKYFNFHDKFLQSLVTAPSSTELREAAEAAIERQRNLPAIEEWANRLAKDIIKSD